MLKTALLLNGCIAIAVDMFGIGKSDVFQHRLFRGKGWYGLLITNEKLK
jgi:hypothetical protein